MQTNPLTTIMAPKSIAFFGAGSNPGKMGSMQFLNLLYSGFPGDIYPVHPREKELFGHRVWPSVKALPEVPDLAILVLPAKVIGEVMAQLGEKGTRHAVIVSAGFTEIGAEGIKQEKELLDICRRHDMRFVGPNCMGIMNTTHPFNCTVAPFFGPPGKLGLISQSGTYVGQVISYLKKRGINFSKAISTGNESSIDLVDCLGYLGEDEETRAIGMYIESIRRGERFLEVARQVSRKKPVLVQYVGGTTAGARAGASHTGAMAGPDYIYNGLFAQAGVIRVNSVEEIYTIGQALATQPLPKSGRVGILTNSGGPATAMATTLEAHGLELPELSAATRRRIDALIPPSATSRNPVDITFHPDISLVAEKIPEILMETPDIDGLLVHGIMDTGWFDAIAPLAEKYLDTSSEALRQVFTADLRRTVTLPARHDKPLLVSSFFQQEDCAARTFMEHQIPVFDGPEKAARAMAVLRQYAQIKNRPPDLPAEKPSPSPEARMFRDKAPAGTLDEADAKTLLAAYGIPVCREIRVKTPEEAVAAARDIGFPVVVKGCHAAITHKSEQGLVHLNLTDKASVEAACRHIVATAGDVAFLVCEQVAGELEVMAGMTRFPGFPPAILFGLGGIYAEVLQDSAVRLAPFGTTEALNQIVSLRSASLLNGYRGQPVADKDALADILVRLGYLALDCPWIRELDINPVCIRQGQPVVVDALVVTGETADLSGIVENDFTVK